MVSKSAISARWSLSRPDDIAAFRFSGRPVAKLSMTTTSWPSASRRSTRWLPIKPAPPVTRHRAEAVILLVRFVLSPTDDPVQHHHEPELVDTLDNVVGLAVEPEVDIARATQRIAGFHARERHDLHPEPARGSHGVKDIR